MTVDLEIRRYVTGQSKGDGFGTKDESIKTGERRKDLSGGGSC
jgi:hypothetical protein